MHGVEVSIDTMKRDKRGASDLGMALGNVPRRGTVVIDSHRLRASVKAWLSPAGGTRSRMSEVAHEFWLTAKADDGHADHTPTAHGEF